MPNKLTASSIYDSLRTISHPEFADRNLVELGMISKVKIESDHILLILTLPGFENPSNQSIVEEVREVVEMHVDDLQVQIEVAEIDEEQRERLKSLLGDSSGEQASINRVRKVIAVMSGKGGVGKSSVAGLLASELRRRTFNVGILDADITGPSIPLLFGSNQLPKEGTQGILPVSSSTGIKLMSINLLLADKDQPVVWRGPLIGRAIQQFWSEIEWGDLDFLIVDLPPGTADASLTVMQSLPLNGIVLVTSPQDLAGMVVRKAANMAKHLGIPLIGLVENMSSMACPNCGETIYVFGQSQTSASAEKIGTQVLGHIPVDPDLSVMCDRGAIEDYHSQEMVQITDRVIEYIKPAEKLSFGALPAA